MSNTFIWPIDRTLSGATTSSQSGPGSDSNEGVLYIPQSSSITGTTLSDCLMSYEGHSLRGGVLPLCKDAIGVFYSPSWLGSLVIEFSLFLDFVQPGGINMWSFDGQPVRTELVSTKLASTSTEISESNLGPANHTVIRWIDWQNVCFGLFKSI